MHFFFILFVDFVALNILVFSCKQDPLCGEIVHQLCQEFQERNCFLLLWKAKQQHFTISFCMKSERTFSCKEEHVKLLWDSL